MVHIVIMQDLKIMRPLRKKIKKLTKLEVILIKGWTDSDELPTSPLSCIKKSKNNLLKYLIFFLNSYVF